MIRTVIFACLLASALGASRRFPRKPLMFGRIVGGSDATIEDYPWQLSYLYSSFHICGASIIGNTVALSAGHCSDGNTPDIVSLRSGSATLENGGTVHEVTEIIMHPDFDYNTLDNDVSILKVATAFELGATAAIIPLASALPADGTLVAVSGWGAVNEGDFDLPTTLQAVEVPIYNQAACNDAYASYGGVTGNMFCAGLEEGGKDSCQGDSGGPVAGGGELIGVVSWGEGCARPGKPGVYASVPALKTWIDSNSA